MKVKILSGNQTGQIVDQPQAEAEANIATGFAELAPDVDVTDEVPAADRRVEDEVPKVLKRVTDYTVSEIEEHASQETDVTKLQTLRDDEAKSEGGGRKGVLAALDARIAELAPPAS